MAHAAALGRRGMGQAWPNPAVGCVIESGGRILGRGWTQPGGRPHAEAMALDQAGARAQGATAHVTLEPCAHVSARGPACAGLLVAAGVARVVTALTDPDPRTAGAGHAHLRAAGIAVTTGVLADELRQDLAGFLLRFAQARPFVTLKLAATLDGRIATQGGESRWITGAPARALVHALRARHDAVMVGAGTVRADDPLLTVRGMGALRQPVRVVLSRALDLPADGALARSVPEAPLWLLHDGTAPAATVARWEGLGARLLPVASGPGGIDPAAALARLAGQGLTRVFCEGGGLLAAALLGAGLVDELHLFTAGAAIGAEGRPLLGPLGLARLVDAPRLALVRQQAIGADLHSIWRPTA
ncbi:MAG: bifunctional diaminohydroxyphosphoribosylaminopyrimidine deaminase/5-amino-6-(5-phosphoribosylamino)uracil reductase RibD [Rubellimicrobium sp.]|nr:bifunctional diaminohydroxyphosphoribosylaminopyrimidine deaminase/5-amino-6-(5-phosphoribosylamino)uracil reductase RibD [Rubellimicrobium sp.]